MMATKKQLAANRANAKHSAGPKSKGGKIRSSMNACKHGLSAEAIMIAGENPAEFDALHRSLVEEFNPRSGAENELVRGLAVLFWRLRRISVFEATFLRTQQPDGAHRDPRVDQLIEIEIFHRTKMREIASRYGNYAAKEKTEEKTVEQEANDAVYDRLLSLQSDQPVPSESHNQEMLARISRYETSLMNTITRTLNMLVVLQNMRGERAERGRITAVK